MTLINSSPRFVRFALILFVLVAFPFAIPSFAKHRKAAAARSSRHGRTERRGRHSVSARRGGRRHGRLSARAGGRRGRRLSAREVRASRARIAHEQTSSLKALERKLHRPLTRRERNAEMRRIESRHRRDLEAARRRAEAARRAAIARQRAIDAAMRNEVQTFISRDITTGEDPEVRRVAINALGNHAGTVVVMDPKTGRVYSLVNQEWGVRRGFKPCSTIKLVTGLAGLNEKVIDTNYTEAAFDRYHLDLTSALARSNNTYFQQVGGRVGFDKMITYARELGLGEKTGINEPSEFSGRLPDVKTGFALNRMSSHGDDFEVTAVQLATLVSAMANGGRLLTPQVPRTRQEDSQFKTKVRRQVNIEPDAWQRMVPGMVGAVNYGSGKRAYDPLQTVAGKTGTCIGDGRTWLGLFTSYAPLVNPKLAVVVITRGTDAHSHLPAAVAGQIYRDLNHRFGTPTNLPIASAPVDGASGDPKIADIDEESKETEAERAKEEGEAEVNTGLMTEETSAPETNATNAKPAVNSKVKRVSMPVPKRNEDTSKPAPGAKAPVKPVTQTADRPRRVGEKP
jgi:penicillin-binding protein 2